MNVSSVSNTSLHHQAVKLEPFKSEESKLEGRDQKIRANDEKHAVEKAQKETKEPAKVQNTPKVEQSNANDVQKQKDANDQLMKRMAAQAAMHPVLHQVREQQNQQSDESANQGESIRQASAGK